MIADRVGIEVRVTLWGSPPCGISEWREGCTICARVKVCARFGVLCFVWIVLVYCWLYASVLFLENVYWWFTNDVKDMWGITSIGYICCGCECSTWFCFEF